VSKETGVGACGGGCEGPSRILVEKRCVLTPESLTPPQAAEVSRANGTYGDWVTDVPIQGPTDETIRSADCWWKNNVLDKVTDLQGRIVPQWTQNQLCIGNRAMSSGIGGVGESVRRGGARMGALGADPSAANSPPSPSALPAPAAPPGIWSKLSDAESHWIAATLIALNGFILKAGNKPCATWPADLLKDDATAISKMPAAVACFQGWYNTNLSPSQALRTDGTLDEKTACALIVVTGQHAGDFPTPYPGTLKCGGLSLYAKIGIGAGVAVAVGGATVAIVAASRKKKSAPATAGEARRTVRYGGKR
jgi:hypothetical protein